MTMQLQDIEKHLNEERTWHIILTTPRKERKTKETLEDKGMIAYLPTIYVMHRWNERIKKIQMPAINRCIFVYASTKEMEMLKMTYPVLSISVAKIGK